MATDTFLSTLSLRRATYRRLAKRVKEQEISIHALLAESDNGAVKKGQVYYVFLSTLSLRRATPIRIAFKTEDRIFLSTLSLRRATVLH